MSDQGNEQPTSSTNGTNGVHPEDITDQGVMEDRLRGMIVGVQKHWLNSYHDSREKVLVTLTEKMHQEFLLEQEKMRSDLLIQFKAELEQARTELEMEYHSALKEEQAKMNEKHRRTMAVSKKKQWCWQCENEAIYYCCWNTSYCSSDCQSGHWPTHRKFCRRKKGNAQSAAEPQPMQ